MTDPTMQGVVEPQTEAGRALLDGGIRDLVRTIRAATGVPDSQTVPGATREMFTAAILAIENEAAERMQLRAIEAETRLSEARAALADAEEWYAAFETVTGSEARTPEGKRRIFDDFWRAFRERTRPPGGPKYGGLITASALDAKTAELLSSEQEPRTEEPR